MKMNIDFETIEELYFTGDFHGAFEACKAIICDLNVTNEVKSDAYNLMAAILLGADPSLAEEDEGVESASYLKSAIELNNSNVEAMLNAIRFYGDSFGKIKDPELLALACRSLNNHIDELDEDDRYLLLFLEKKYL